MAVVDPMNQAAEPVVQVTPAAARRLRQLMARREPQAGCVRIGVKGGGCSGLSYTLGLDAEPRERDLVWSVEGVTVAVDPRSARHLEQVTLDFSLENIMEGGFRFTNPNAERTCGCGTSFQPKKR